MKKTVFIVLLMMQIIASNAQSASIPHLQTRGSATQLIVSGKPFLVLGGELHNSSPSGADYMRPIWKLLREKNLNTVFAPRLLGVDGTQGG